MRTHIRSGTKRVSLKFEGVLLDCEFQYYPGHSGDQDSPPEPENTEFNFVKHSGEDIYSLLGDENVRALSDKCIARIRSEIEGG